MILNLKDLPLTKLENLLISGVMADAETIVIDGQPVRKDYVAAKLACEFYRRLVITSNTFDKLSAAVEALISSDFKSASDMHQHLKTMGVFLSKEDEIHSLHAAEQADAGHVNAECCCAVNRRDDGIWQIIPDINCSKHSNLLLCL
jgi:hypothetical protein